MSTGPAGDPRTFAPVIRTQTDLQAAWAELIRPLGFHRTSVWLMMIRADGIPLPQLVEIADCPSEPTRADADALAAMLAHFAADAPVRPDQAGARWAVLRSRPGPGRLVEADRFWAATLHAACSATGVHLAPLHVAGDDEVRPVPLDELRRAS